MHDAKRRPFTPCGCRLAERGQAIVRLLADATTRPHAEVEGALPAKTGSGDLFEDRMQLLARAYDARDRAMLKP